MNVKANLIAAEIVFPAPHRKGALELNSPFIIFYFTNSDERNIPPLEFSFNVFQIVP